jgi:hypothetical protein
VHFVTVSQDGTFRIPALLPGQYLAAVVDENLLDSASGAGKELLLSLAAQATRVTLTAGDGNTVSLQVAPVRR